MRAAVLGLAYFSAAELGHALTTQAGNFATFWPPAGVWLSALLVSALGDWPLLMLAGLAGNFLSNALHHQSPGLNVAFCLVNALSAIGSAMLLRRLTRGRRFALETTVRVVQFAAATTLMTVAFGALGGALVHAIHGVDFLSAWSRWWISDLAGIWLTAPMILAAANGEQFPRYRSVWALAAEATAAMACLFAVGVGVYFQRLGWFTARPLPLLVLLWVTVRFGTMGTGIGMFIVSILMTTATTNGRGPFFDASATPEEAMFRAMLHLGVWFIIFHSVAALLQERRRAMDRTLQLNAELEQRVTERTAALAAANDTLRVSEERLNTVIESLSEGIIIADKNGELIHWNRAALEMHGYTSLAECRRKLPEFVDTFELWTLDGSRMLSFEEWPMPRIRRGEVLRDCELRLRRIDQAWEKICTYSGAIVHSITGEELVYLATSDITASKLAERSLRQSEERLRLAAEAAKFGLYDIDVQTGRAYWSPQMRAILGLPEDAPVGKPGQVPSFVHPDDRERVKAVIERAYDPRGPGTFDDEYRVLRPDGTVRWVLVKGQIQFEGEGDTRVPVRSSGVLLDVTARRADEAALRATEQRFRQLAESLPQLVWTCDSNGSCDYLSPQWTEFTGAERDTKLGFGWLESVHPDDVQRAIDAWRMAMPVGGTFDTEFRLRRADGVYRWFRGRAVPVRDENGEIVKWFGTNTDIEDLKQAYAVAASLAAIVTSSEDAIIGTDLAGIVTSWNRGAERIFGYTAAEMIGRRMAELYPPERLEEEREILESLRSGRTIQHYESERVTKDGRIIDVAVSGSPISDRSGVIIGASKIARDITDAKRAERHLREAKEAAEAANRTKDEFLAALSHELRTPLSPVLLLASELEKIAELPVPVRHDIATIRKNVELEARLIDDLLDVTSIARGKLRLSLQPVAAHQLLHETFEILREGIANKHLDFIVELHAEKDLVEADPVRLRQIFWNVLRNAIKFTPERGRITVRTASREQRFALEVEDNGAGIDAAEIGSIFEAFNQGGAGHRFGGLGLGLTITNRLLQMHGGGICVESRGRGQGATFHIDLPLSTKAHVTPPPPAPNANRTSSHALSILLVDDHEPTRETLRKLLERRGHKVSAAETLQGARELAFAGQFDVLLSDLGLPDGDGTALMRELAAVHGPPGIALSGYGHEQDIRRSLDAGFSAHLTKPIDVQALERALADVSRDRVS